MKDSYSFDRDEEGLDASFRAHEGAYDRIFERCGLEVLRASQAESGMMGGSESIDFLAPSGSGENTLVTCENGDYAADLEVARAIPRAPEFPRAARRAGGGRDAGRDDDRGAGASCSASTRPRRRRRCRSSRDDGTRRARARARRRPARGGEARWRRSAPAYRPATEDEIRAAFGADPGSLGPVGFAGEVVADEALREGQFVAGANRTGWHLRGVEAGRDFEARFADIRAAARRATAARSAAARCASRPRSRSATSSSSARATRSRSARRSSTRTARRSRSSWAATGSGPARVHGRGGRAAPRRARHRLAAGDRAVRRARRRRCRARRSTARQAAAALDAAGVDVLLDDRDLRAGEKFADADLIGLPMRVTVGKKTLEDGTVDVRDRATGEERRVALPNWARTC